MTADTLANANVVVDHAWRQRMLLDPSYVYTTKPHEEPLIRRLLEALFRWLTDLTNTRFDGAGDLIGYAVILGVIVLVVYLISRSSKQGLFESSGASAMAMGEESLEPTVDLDRLIGIAVADGNFRLAVRLLYRRTLAEMRDEKMIVYRPEKTDAEYIRELHSVAIARAFQAAVSHFHQAWYGMEEVEQEQYHQALTAFNDVRSLLTTQR